jgi:hypothetical protein
MNGTSTPKDLNSRIKIIELFTLHVLPANAEWDYARSFVSNSDILDEERREAFIQTLAELQEAKDQESAVEDDTDYTEDEEPEPREPQQNGHKGHQRTSSEVDYGIESAYPNGTSDQPPTHQRPKSPPPTSRGLTNIPPQPEPTPTRAPHLSPPAQTPRRVPQKRSKSKQQSSLTAQARALFAALTNLTRNLGGALIGNSNAVFRLLLFLVAFFMAFSRPEIRQRVQALIGKSWEKMQRTVGMGVKVSYI